MAEFDIIVIGGGSAGSAVAGRLSEDGKRSVCLIEAGGNNNNFLVKTPGMMPFLLKNANWRFDTVPQKGLNGRIGYQPRGRGLGGSSAINAMVYIRGNKWDYDNWAAMGCDGWSYDEVLPWFKKSEGNERGGDAWHGGEGPLSVSDQKWLNPGSIAFVEAARNLQMPILDDFNGEKQEGIGIYQVTQKGGERWSAARAYVEPGRGRANLEIRTRSLVERLIVENGRVTGVQIKRGFSRETLKARGAVVLSAGAFGSPHILQLSGIGPGDHLREKGAEVVLDKPDVGSHLKDHIDFVSGYLTESKELIGDSLEGTVRMGKAIIEHRMRRTGIMTTPYAEAGGFWSSDPDVPAPDIQYHFVPAVLEDHGREKVKGHGFSCHACVLRPHSKGTVRLNDTDPSAPPRIDPNFLDDDRDIATLRKGVRNMQRIMEAPPLTDFKPTNRHPIDMADDDALDALIRARADTVYHPVGTCRMGADEDAVVDSRLKFRGLDGLYIADASIMPEIVSGNTNAPSIMIGERAADFIKADLAA
ncbi:Choline dehydrogenase [Parasphingorhabdus marina DSM 22363]|uniref:Choline dehydrogenase n=1 Tax=Parasphingorhabdus marina DSM 22363 TaxID=1123272 RepID=A0A1N6H3S9_9SPHN|nr:GMC family oxidoreductase N-terminal domain-containing protein [Parasphingorhabdus marina]SIO14461.1 Choline dehydrogenase [Parasphingorhabdus marina DSM 22363]